MTNWIILKTLLLNKILPFFKKNWHYIVIFLLIIFLVFKEDGTKKIIKEYQKQIKDSENVIKQYEKDIKLIDKKMDSIEKIINKLSELDKENEEKIKEVDKKGNKKKKEIDEENNPNVLIEEYKKTIKKHEKD